MPDDGEAEEDFSKLPALERLAHKKWNARLSGYQDLVKTFGKTVSEDDPALQPFTNDPDILRRAALESHVVAHETALEFIAAYINAAGSRASRTREAVLPAVIEKGLSSTRTKAKGNAIEVCMLYTEVEDRADGVVAAIVENGITPPKKPLPKLVVGAISALAKLVQDFGPKVVDFKTVLALLPTLFASTDGGIRKAASELVMEFYRWLGDGLKPALKDLKPVQVNELEKTWKELNSKGEGAGTGKQTRHTLSQQRDKEVKQAEGALEGNANEEAAAAEDEEAPQIDVRDLADPVDVAARLPPDFYTHLNSAKWKDKKELALEPLLKVIDVPKIVDNAECAELVRAAAAKISDGNVFVATAAIQCIGLFANGLREGFAKHRADVVPALLERFKEKKQSVVDAIAASLDSIFLSGSMQTVVDEVATVSGHKLAQVREQALLWIVRCLKAVKRAPSAEEMKALATHLALKCADADNAVRQAASLALAHMIKIYGDKLQPFISDIDSKRQTEITKLVEDESTQVQCKASLAPVRKAAAPAARPLVAKVVQPPKPRPATADKENIAPGSPPTAVAARPTPATPARQAKPPAARATPKAAAPIARKPVNGPAAPAASSSKAPSKTTAGAAEPPKYRYTQEEADAQAADQLPDGVAAGLAEGNWKARLETITDKLLPWLKDGGADSMDAELIVRALANKPGWKESNFQVWNKMVEVLSTLAELSPTWSKGCMALCIPPLTDKLGDIKIKASAGAALVLFAEKSSLGCVLGQMYEPITKQKAPKAVADCITWIGTALSDFGIPGVALRDLIACLNAALLNTNPAVRTAAVKTFVTLQLFAGPDVKDLLQGLAPALENTIAADYTKAAAGDKPVPTRSCADLAAPSAAEGGARAGGKGKAPAGAADQMDELFPRAEVDKLVSAASIAALSDAQWKPRKEALEALQSALEQNKRLKPTMTELGVPLKLRLGDANKVVQNLAMDVVARIATGMDKGFERHARNLAPAVVNVLADKNGSTRQSGLRTLTAMAEASGLAALIPALAAALEQPKYELRLEILTWLRPRLEEAGDLDLKPFAGSIIACLEDAKSDIKTLAKAVLPIIVANAGYEHVIDKTSELKPASRAAVIPHIDAARGGGVLAASHPAPAPRPVSAVPAGLRAPAAAPPSPARAAAPDSPGRLPKPRIPSGPAVGLKRSVGPEAVVAARRQSIAPEPAAPSAFPLKSASPTQKLVRASKELKGQAWAAEGVVRPEQVEQLHQQIGPHVTAELLGLLFSKDHHSERDYLAGLALIDQAIPFGDADDYLGLSADEARARVLANSDLIMKYLSLRLLENSPTLNNRCLDVLDHLCVVYSQNNSSLSDYEASCFLPALIVKVGDQREHMRIRIRAMFRSLTSIFAYSKVFNLLLEHGLSSKNARTRAECADELGQLFTRQGMSVCQPARALPAIAALIGDRDAAVRSSTLTTLAIVYGSIGSEQLDRYLGALPQKEKGLLDEKLKRTKTIASPPRPLSTPGRTAGARPVDDSPVAGPSSAARRGIARPRSSMLPNMRREEHEERVVKQESESPPHRVKRESASPPPPAQPPRAGLPVPRGIGRRQSLAQMNGHAAAPPARALPVPVVPAARPPSDDIEALFTAIQSPDPDEAVDALKTVHKQLADETELFVDHVNELVDATCLQMRTFEALQLEGGDRTPMLRLCKHLLHVLNTLFDKPVLAQAVLRKALIQLLAELTRHLLETADDVTTAEVQNLSKVINMVLIRIFHNANRNTCFGALFSVLQTITANFRDLHGEDLANRAKYAELVMKCLWKVSKMSKDILEDGSLEPKQLLLDIDDFLNGISPAEWRRRSADNVPLGDMPLRTVKTILQQMVKVFGESVYEQLDLVKEGSFVQAYLQRLLANPRGGAESRPGSVASTASGRAPAKHDSPDNVMDAPISPENQQVAAEEPMSEAEKEFKTICARIQDPASSKQGIRDLYDFRKTHPEFEKRITKWVEQTGTHFQAYIRRTMSNLAQEEGQPAETDSPKLEHRPSLRGLGLGPAPASPTPAVPRSRVSSVNPQEDEESKQKLAHLQSLFKYRGGPSGQQ